ncbi:hypothetical protein TCAL_07780 [Tigriopus californicus]|uniref:EamA domain-containing protein n=2 Tax=Tigriopus californicus TaxID=6832 RepID=A0A553P6X0_TIGCA|nr:hypothetical protein TCAL_07780 [Tigriopus californicus]|eukprot:TCALIF_07780-PA protein Name:"Protein of unknown function" AED:0.05 eAED:0.05 QI:0/1/0.75/1/1/1/4/38/571
MSYSNTLKDLFYKKETQERSVAVLAAATHNVSTPAIVVDHPSSDEGGESPLGSPQSVRRKKHLSPLDLRLSIGSLSAPASPTPSLRSRSSTFFRMHSASLTSLFEKDRRQQLVESHMGLALALLSAILMSVYSHMYKQISDQIAKPTVLILRGVIQAMVMFLIAQRSNTPLKAKNVPPGTTFWQKYKVYMILLTVVLIGGIRLCLIFAGLQLIHMSTVHTILNGSPILVMVLSHFLLQNDRFSWVKGLSCVLLVGGVVLNFQPYKWLNDKFEIGFGLGVAFSLGALVFSACGSVFTKMITKNFSKLHIAAYIGLSILVVALLSLLTDSLVMNLVKGDVDPALEDQLLDIFPNTTILEDHDGLDVACIVRKILDEYQLNTTSFEMENSTSIPEDVRHACLIKEPPLLPIHPGVWINAIFVGIMGSIQQFCIIAALQKDKPSKVTMVRSLNILISFTIQSSTDAMPNPLEAIGALLVLVAITFVAFEAPVTKAMQEIPCIGKYLKKEEAPPPGPLRKGLTPSISKKIADSNQNKQSKETSSQSKTKSEQQKQDDANKDAGRALRIYPLPGQAK